MRSGRAGMAPVFAPGTAAHWPLGPAYLPLAPPSEVSTWKRSLLAFFGREERLVLHAEDVQTHSRCSAVLLEMQCNQRDDLSNKTGRSGVCTVSIGACRVALNWLSSFSAPCSTAPFPAPPSRPTPLLHSTYQSHSLSFDIHTRYCSIFASTNHSLFLPPLCTLIHSFCTASRDNKG